MPLPQGHNAFAYVYEGSARIGVDGDVKSVDRGELAVLVDADHVHVASGDSAIRLIVVAGKPLREPVARHGPFVMNTPEQIVEAFQDFQSGKF